jgi:predicted PurR-regulated permease PerM
VAVARFALGVLSGALSLVLVLLITLYFVVDGLRIREYLLGFLLPAQRARVRAATDRMGQRMGGWLLGQLALSATVGLVSFVGLSVLGIKGALLLAVIAAIGEVIPIVGPIAAAVPAVLVAATYSPVQAVLTLVLYVLIQQLENNLLVPKIMERAVALHPMAVVLSLLVGGELLGILGAIVSVPVAAAISVALDEVRLERQRVASDLAAPAAPPLPADTPRTAQPRASPGGAGPSAD